MGKPPGTKRRKGFVKTAIVIGPAGTEENARELIAAARKAGSSRIELWRFGAENPLPENIPLEEILYLFGDGPALAEPYIPILCRLAEERKPELVLFGPEILTRDLCCALAAHLKSICALNITGIEQKSGGLQIVRRVFGLQLEAAFLYTRPPYLFSIAKDSFEPAEDEGRPIVSARAISLPEPDWYEDYREIREEAQGGLESCCLILAGGRGLGSKTAMADMAELGRRMGAGVGATRPAALNAWLPLSQMIGLSGLVVKPKLCISFGISGCAPFIKGVEKSGCIIAVNQDPEAAIFRYCDVGLVADCNVVIKSLLKRIGDQEIPGAKNE
jgi:electron transfer flavoprotein alpha subunit